jgi:hypothetical protein
LTRTFRLAPFLGIIAVLLAGCSSTVSMQMPTIPEPRLDKIPASVAVRMPEDFYNFVHTEDVLGKDKWTIELGNSNVNFFTQLFGYMFDTVTILDADDDPRDFTFDALIEPSIEGFEFSVPSQTQAAAFSVWIRYRMNVFDRLGNRASSFTISAYGKSQKEGLGGSDALKRAAVLAMRDAAALMVMQTDKVSKIRELADGSLDPASLEPETSVAEATPPEDEEPASVLGVFAIGGIDDAAE